MTRFPSATGPPILRRLIRPDRTAIAPIAAFCVCAGGALGFIVVADSVLAGDSRAIDEAILLALRSSDDTADPIGPAWLEIFFGDVTALGGYPVLTLVGLLAAGYLALLRRWGNLVLLAMSLAGGAILNSAFKTVFDRPRPDLVAHLVEVQTASLPSGHATGSAVAFLTLGALLAQVQPRQRLKLYIVSAAVGLTLLVGFSRIYLGVHYPTDVLAGWSLGAAWAMGCWSAAWLLERRRQAPKNHP